jgi:hypothetical protein
MHYKAVQLRQEHSLQAPAAVHQQERQGAVLGMQAAGNGSGSRLQTGVSTDLITWISLQSQLNPQKTSERLFGVFVFFLVFFHIPKLILRGMAVDC